MTALDSARRARLEAAPAFLRGGFRPFFFGGAAWAVIVVLLWLAAFSGAIELPTAFDPLAWHRHEMLFGYLGAVIAGFLMTAVPNWTGRLPIAGMPLAAFAGLWLAARLAMLFSDIVGPVAAAVLDVGFLLVLATVTGREVVAAKNRNLPVVAIVLLLAIASLIDHGEALGAVEANGLGYRLGFGLVLVLIALIGGRIIPSFTRNWLMKRNEKERLPGQPDRFDSTAMAMIGAAFAAWALYPDALFSSVLLILSGLLHLARLARWSGLRTTADPLVFVLHIAYLWLPVGALLLGASIAVPDLPATVALHALAAGAMASMTLAVMARATRGHTGRPLKADAATTVIFIAVNLGAALRVAAPVLPFDYLRLVELAGALWGGAFLLFLAAYGPMLLLPRADGRP